MPLSPATLQFIAALRGEELATDNRCTAISQAILDTFGVGAFREALHHDIVLEGLRNRSAEDGLYELRLDVGDAGTWQHGLVLLKNGRDIALLHGWVGKFTLAQWLDPHNGGNVAPRCFDLFSPATALFDPEDMTPWLDSLATLEVFRASGFADFTDRCRLLFGVELGVVDRLAHGFGRPLHFAWRFRRIDAHVYE